MKIAILALLIIGIVFFAGCATKPAANNSLVNNASVNTSVQNQTNASNRLTANEAKVLGTDPLNPDTDGDGVLDTVDKTPLWVDSPPAESTGVADFSIKALVLENNFDPLTGNSVPDHMEIILSNNGKHNITNFVVLYYETDMKTNQQQSYLVHLNNFTLAAGQNKSVHIDLQGGVIVGDYVLEGIKGHYRANPNDLYHTSQNGVKVDVTVNAEDHQAQKAEQIKSAGGAETPD